MERLAKRLKKEKVHVDIVSFGEEEQNIDKLTHFIETLNGAEQKESYNKYTYCTSHYLLIGITFTDVILFKHALVQCYLMY